MGCRPGAGSVGGHLAVGGDLREERVAVGPGEHAPKHHAVVARAAQGAHLVYALDAAAREARGVGRQRGRERASMAAHEAAGRAVALSKAGSACVSRVANRLANPSLSYA